ncbi:alpha/beta hydrolase [Acerihabitans arboris]|uniref:Alpha/beta fold hydrolase n=1 Tax=Acerihabitans arboris TaxID=2691583 RepID=A0A845SCP8_9GAMM|nr:alpha/beta hydrolase [Acerihabitans arboris]NDL61187.1 alpha/beta fold hydrolase [Acerihabitans arboris]
MLKKTLTSLAAGLALAFAAQGVALASPVKNIVLVHGAFADGSGWREVTRILDKAGYHVSIVQEPQTSLADDVAATRRILGQQQGKSLLVGHSYGGFIISEAGQDPSVAGLVYIAAFQPEKGETLAGLSSKIPQASQGITQTGDRFLYLKPELYHADFAADLPASQANFMARSQVMPAAAIFSTPAVEPAWKTKPSWALVATQDRAINPDLERFMAKRAKSSIIEVKASHAVYASQPRQVATLIEKAAQKLSE